MREHAPLDLGPDERGQSPEVDLRGPEHCRRGRAPALEGTLVRVADRNGQPAAFAAVAPLGRQGSPSPAALPAVAPPLAEAQPERGIRPLPADLDAAAAQTRGQVRP